MTRARILLFVMLTGSVVSAPIHVVRWWQEAASQAWVPTVAIKGDSTASYVDTGLIPQNDDIVKILLKPEGGGATDRHGKSTADGGGWFGFGGLGTEWQAAKGASQLTGGTLDTNWHFCVYQDGGATDGLKVDGSLVVDLSAISQDPDPSSNSFYIFALNIGAANNPCGSSVARMQVIRAGAVIADLQANSDGTFHDVIRGGTYGNSGGGTLTVVDITGETLPTQDWQ